LIVCWDSEENLPVTDAEISLVSALLQHLTGMMAIESVIEPAGSIEPSAGSIRRDTGV
jgi:hypothetical protein